MWEHVEEIDARRKMTPDGVFLMKPVTVDGSRYHAQSTGALITVGIRFRPEANQP